MPAYAVTATDAHGRDEERQWADILCTGRPAEGMALLFIQKLCAAFHEFEPAWRAGALKADRLPFFRRRLAARIRRVLAALQANGLGEIDGGAEMAALLTAVESAETMDVLAGLADDVHAVNHTLCDALENR